MIGAASFTIYSGTKEYFAKHNILCRNSMVDAALTGGISGAMSGALISFASARMYSVQSRFVHHLTVISAFELVKVDLYIVLARGIF